MSSTHRRAALVPTILGELLSQGSSPSNPVFAGNPAGISKDAVRFRASLTKLVCADILLILSLIHCGFAVHKSPCLTANFRLVLCRSDRACNLMASRLPSLLQQESTIRVQATTPSITSNSCVRSGPVTEYTAPN